MNWVLKTRIIERFGTQADFAYAIRGAEAVVSKVVRGRRTLSAEERQRWAEVLEVDCKELFGMEANRGEAYARETSS